MLPLALVRFLLTVALAVLLVGAGMAQPGQPGIGSPAKLEGKILHKANPDDVRVLGLLGFSLINEAKAKGENLPFEQTGLSLLAMKAYNDKDYETAFRFACRFNLLRRGSKLSEGTEVASSYDFKLGRKIVPPGETLPILLQPLFTLGKPLSGAYTAKLSLHAASGDLIGAINPLTIKDITDLRTEIAVKTLKEGKYAIHYELLSPAGQSLVKCDREFIVHAGVKPRVAALKKQLDLLRASAAPRGLPWTAALEALEFLVELFERTLKEYVAPMSRTSHPMVLKLRGLDMSRYLSEPFDIDKDLGLAEHLASDLLAGKNPLATRTGDLHLSYRSAVDSTLQPFRVYIPKGYDPARKYPLVVALHGATGDENTYMDRYPAPGTQESLLKKLAEERGYLLVTPNGRGTFGGYVDTSEKDVLDVLERVQQLYAVHPRQVFLTGHSMGGVGTWLLGFKHPTRFAALAPVCGRPPDVKSIAFKNAPQMPVLYAQGGKDTLATPEQARQLAKVAQQALKHFRYLERTEDDHFVIGVTSMPAIFDFFDAHKRP